VVDGRAVVGGKELKGRTVMANEDLIYLASPYSNPDRAVRVERFNAACRAAAKLMHQGKLIFCPIAHTHPIAEIGGLPLGWMFWERYDQAMLAVCGRMIVLRLDGWEMSLGVAAEIKAMRDAGKPVEFMDQD
jgi:hypothetical protein